MGILIPKIYWLLKGNFSGDQLLTKKAKLPSLKLTQASIGKTGYVIAGPRHPYQIISFCNKFLTASMRPGLPRFGSVGPVLAWPGNAGGSVGIVETPWSAVGPVTFITNSMNNNFCTLCDVTC